MSPCPYPDDNHYTTSYIIIVSLIISPWKISDEHTKHRFIRYFIFKSPSEREKQSMNTELTALAGQREKTGHAERDGRPRIIFNFFSWSSNMRFLAGSALTAVRPGSNCSFHHRIRQPTLIFSLSGLATDSFLSFFTPHPLPYCVFIWVRFSQSELLVDLLLKRFYS